MKEPKGKVISRSMKAAGIEGGIADQVRKGEWQLAKEKSIPGAPKKKKHANKVLALSEGELQEMARDKAGGKTTREIARKYGLGMDYVRDAISKHFTNNAKGRDILKGVILEGAIMSGMVVHEKVGELTGPQAVIATTTLTGKYIELDKHTSSQRQTIDYAELLDTGDSLRELRKLVGEDVAENNVIDIDAIVIDKSDKKKKSKQLRLKG